MKKQDLIYYAGFFDGEGCVSLCKKKGNSYKRGYSYQLVVTIANTNKNILEPLHKEHGGYYQRVENKSTPQGRDIYVWRILCDKGLRFLKDIYPFVRMKKRQIEIAEARIKAQATPLL